MAPIGVNGEKVMSWKFMAGMKKTGIKNLAGLLLNVQPVEIANVINYSRLGALISILNASLIGVCLWSDQQSIFLSLWLMASIALFLFIAYRSHKAQSYKPKKVSRKAVQRLSLFTLLHALPWTTLTIVFLGTASMRDNLLIIMVAAGMSFSGGFLLYRVPLAALCYSGSIILAVVLSVIFKAFSELWAVIFYAGTYAYALAYIIMLSWKIAREREANLDKANRANCELQAANQEIKRLAMRDTLTNLANKDAFGEILETRVANHTETDHFAVFLLDLDRFKNVNDSVGHYAGDMLLKIVTGHLLQTKRETDVLARFGGDEFALIIDLIGDEHAPETIAEKFLEQLNNPVLIEGALLYPNASIGIAIYPDHAQNAGELVRVADIALHHAKEAGRGRFQIYNDCLGASQAKADEVEAAIRDAFKDDRIEMYYQPKVDMRTGEYAGSEALVRWFTEDGKPANLMDLLVVSADRGLIPQLSSFIFDRVTQDILKWKKQDINATPVSINVHPHDLKTPQLLLKRIRSMLEAGLSTSDFILEVTEGCFVDGESDEATVTLDTISEMGIKLSLDDFGTGHASLSHLKRLPVNEIKIDREFIKGICDNKTDQALATAAIEISRCLEICCVAEGVETEEQAQALRDIIRNEGILLGQGYLWAKPMPAKDLTRSLKHFQSEEIKQKTKQKFSAI